MKENKTFFLPRVFFSPILIFISILFPQWRGLGPERVGVESYTANERASEYRLKRKQ